MENVFDEIIKMLCWWFFRSHSKCKLSVKKSIIGFILKFSSKHHHEAVNSSSSHWVSQTQQDSQHHELGIYLSHNFEEWNPLTQKFDSNGKYVMDKQARDIRRKKSQVNNNLFFGREKCGLLLCIYCMQMSRLEPWSTIATQLLIEYLCNMNHNIPDHLSSSQPSHSWCYRVWLCLVSWCWDCECRKYLRGWDLIPRLSGGALLVIIIALIWFIPSYLEQAIISLGHQDVN